MLADTGNNIFNIHPTSTIMIVENIQDSIYFQYIYMVATPHNILSGFVKKNRPLLIVL